MLNFMHSQPKYSVFAYKWQKFADKISFLWQYHGQQDDYQASAETAEYIHEAVSQIAVNHPECCEILHEAEPYKKGNNNHNFSIFCCADQRGGYIAASYKPAYVHIKERTGTGLDAQRKPKKIFWSIVAKSKEQTYK